MSILICSICGREIGQKTLKKTGRPRKFHDDCRKMQNAVSMLETHIVKFKKMKPLKVNKNTLRKHIWSITNQLN